MKTPSSNRIIPGERLTQAVPFDLGALPDGPADGSRGSARARANGSGGEPLDPLRHSFELGYQKGLAAGEARAAQALEAQAGALGASLAQRMESLLRSAESELDVFREHAAERLVGLAVELARQVIRKSLADDPSAIVAVVQEVLATELEAEIPATLSMHPADLDVVRQALAPVLARRHIELHADASITPGGCRLVSAHAIIDATLQERWSRVMAAIGRPAETAAGHVGGADER